MLAPLSKTHQVSLLIYRVPSYDSWTVGTTVPVVQISCLLSCSRIAEAVFSIPGLCRPLVDSIIFRDYKVVQALLLFFAAEYIFINLIVDVLYGVINPKVRYD